MQQAVAASRAPISGEVIRSEETTGEIDQASYEQKNRRQCVEMKRQSSETVERPKIQMEIRSGCETQTCPGHEDNGAECPEPGDGERGILAAKYRRQDQPGCAQSEKEQKSGAGIRSHIRPPLVNAGERLLAFSCLP